MEIIKNTDKIAIFGAQAIACGIARTLIDVYNIVPSAFLVSKLEGNPSEIYGIPVYRLEEAGYLSDSLIIIATPETIHSGIIGQLRSDGFEKLLPIDSSFEYEIMSDYFRNMNRFKLLEDIPPSPDTPQVQIFRINSGNDLAVVKNESRENTVDILAGAALSDNSSIDLKDNTGDNISRKNRDYCELTAVYWAFKNIKADYKGVCHYRRYLGLDTRDYMRLCNVDAVLPLPLVNYPNAYAHFIRYNSRDVFDVMEGVLKRKYIHYFKASERYFMKPYTYNYNMVIAKNDVFDKYCQFLFDILFEIEKIMNERDIEHIPRYIGYIGETLTSLYFMVNAEGLKIAHAPRILLV